MRYESVVLLNAVAMASNQTSKILDLRNVINLSLTFLVANASSPTGTVAIQFANDCTVRDDGTISGGNFAVDAAAAAAPVVTANGAKVWNMSELGHLFARIVYTTGTGTGNLTVVAGSKGA